MFNLAIDSKLRGCDVVAIKVEDVAASGYTADRATVRQKKTGQPVRFELSEQTRQAVDDYLNAASKKPGEFLFTGHRGSEHNMTTRQYARLVSEWIGSVGRIKNFAALTIADTFVNVEGRWWLHIPSDHTKSHCVDERQVPQFMNDAITSYIETHRPVLCRGAEHLALWVSSTTGQRLTTKNLGTLISKLTHETIGVDVSPHLFRTAGASTAAVYGGNHPHLASALLNHRDPRVTQEHYNRATTFSAGDEYSLITQFYRVHKSGD